MEQRDNAGEDLFEEELTLLSLYLASWTEVEGLPPRAWKNHRFEIMGALADKGYLLDSKGRKSVNFTPEGMAAAKGLEKKYRQRAGKEAQ